MRFFSPVIICDNVLYTKYSNVHHPPIMMDVGGKEEDSYEYIKVESERPQESVRRKKQQLSAHERNSSASALLTQHLSPNNYELDRISLARTEEESSIYRDEDNLRGEEEGLSS